MASSNLQARGRVEADLAPQRRDAAAMISSERIEVSELASDRAGAASPFGDDIRFPLPIHQLTYVHPTADAQPQHH